MAEGGLLPHVGDGQLGVGLAAGDGAVAAAGSDGNVARIGVKGTVEQVARLHARDEYTGLDIEFLQCCIHCRDVFFVFNNVFFLLVL